MKEILQKIGLFFISIILMGGLKILFKTGNEILPEVMQKMAIKAAQELGKQYRKEDIENDDSLSYDDYVNYFLNEISLAEQQLDKLKSSDTSLSIEVKKNFLWLRKYAFNNLSITDSLLEIVKDTSNYDVQKGGKYYLRLFCANEFLRNNSFKDFIYDDFVKTNLKSSKEALKKAIHNQYKKKEIINISLGNYLCRNYYPYHKELIDKIMSEESISQ